ncbi:MAG: hypothetical protein K5857_00425 [Lachnospiraceae bacterium]|nr:hypothetical protein [Lachnospiraceae bacterium]
MRYLALIVPALAGGLIIRKKNKYTNRILLVLGIVTALAACLYNIRTMGRLLTFIHPINQTFYQTDFLNEGSYPDSLLYMVLKDKTVYVKDDVYMIGDPEKHGKTFNYALYHARNEYYLLEYLNTNLIKDASMNGLLISDEKTESDFASAGGINDMLRYCFLYGDLLYESANYFAYYWYYYEFLDHIQAYVCTQTDSQGETVFTSDSLVMFWNTVDGVEEEDLYIMTRDYYEKEIAGNE